MKIMNKKKKVYLYLLVLIIIFISFSFIQGKNIFWGFKDKIKKESGIEYKIKQDLLNTPEFLPRIISPSEGDIVTQPVTIKGTISIQVDHIEIKLDDGKWKKITEKPSWSNTYSGMSVGKHTVFIHAIKDTIQGPDISLTFYSSPLSPTGVIASDGTYIDKVRIIWNSVSGAEKYYIYRSTSSGGTYTEIGNTNAITFDDMIIVNNTVFYYKIKAYSSSAGYSGFSHFNDGYRLFSGPTGIVASDGTYIDKVQITWNSVTGAEKYYVYRSRSKCMDN